MVIPTPFMPTLTSSWNEKHMIGIRIGQSIGPFIKQVSEVTHVPNFDKVNKFVTFPYTNKTLLNIG